MAPKQSRRAGMVRPESAPSSLPSFGQFDFDLARAVLGQLVKAFEKLGNGKLTLEAIAEIGNLPGVYQLYLQGILVYVGKADNNLAKRLSDHYWNIHGRKNISVDDMEFRCLAIHPNWAPLTHESLLIRHYKRDGGCEWNTTGVGNHDPGRKRDDFRPGPFDVLYPINEMLPCRDVRAGEYNANDLLIQVKTALPFVLRYQVTNTKQWKMGHPDYTSLRISVPDDEMPAEEMVKLLVQHPYRSRSRGLSGQYVREYPLLRSVFLRFLVVT